jgi:type I restriction enzyme S subunit
MKEKLIDICNPKQWKTLSTSELLEDGYSVYGANGIIGYYNTYNHEKETVMVTCRGATCGTVNISKPFSYINGNAMCMDDVREDIDTKYLYYALKHFDFSDVISGSAQPQITRQGLNLIQIEVVKKKKQLEIVKVLSNVEEIINKKTLQLSEYDQLIKSRFVEMFGNVDLRKKQDNWIKLGVITEIITGTTPSTTDENNWGGDNLWITPAELQENSFYVHDTERKLTGKGLRSKSLSIMPTGTVLLSTRAPIGKTAIVGNPMSCNQGFKNFICNDRLNPVYLYSLLKYNTEYLNSIGTGTTFKEISKSTVSNIEIPVPKITVQNHFAQFVQQVDKLKFEECFMHN